MGPAKDMPPAFSRPGQRQKQAGISMIEVLTAMAIFSSSAAILFAWIGQTADRLGKLETEQRQRFAELAALEFARSLNPMDQPSGRTKLQQDLEVNWQATPVGVAEQVRISPTSPGVYQVQLYKVQLQIHPPSAGSSLPPLSVYLAGWRQTLEANKRESPFQN